VAARDAGMPIDVVVELIRLFSFDVDFQREIQAGDSFEVLYDSYYDRAGSLAKTGPLRYGAMMLSGKRLEFYHFVTADGTDDHFDPKGRSVRKTLLRTPVDGARISSGYGKRKHPIQGYNKMHRGVDFAAPRGTPIYAAGHGVVERIGRNGGYGKYVRIRHNSTYKTAYAHLKSYAKGMKRGVRVKQGQVIGYVGSTGNSTGPHLHYEVFYDSKQVNPLKVKLPSGKKLAGADLEAFQTARAEADSLLADALGGSLLAETGCGGDLPLAVAAGSGTPAEPPAPGPSSC
jgi:murein DD-endopeptidase MepM/ murein hydrolase activator NlpD